MVAAPGSSWHTNTRWLCLKGGGGGIAVTLNDRISIRMDPTHSYKYPEEMFALGRGGGG